MRAPAAAANVEDQELDVAAWVAESRLRQGLPAHVADPGTLGRLAAILREAVR